MVSCFHVLSSIISVLDLPSDALLHALCAPQHFAATPVGHLIMPVLAEWHRPDNAHVM